MHRRDAHCHVRIIDARMYPLQGLSMFKVVGLKSQGGGDNIASLQKQMALNSLSVEFAQYLRRNYLFPFHR